MYLHKTVLVSCHIIDSPQAIPLAAAMAWLHLNYRKGSSKTVFFYKNFIAESKLVK